MWSYDFAAFVFLLAFDLFVVLAFGRSSRHSPDGD
jgi:hypothetical protein